MAAKSISAEEIAEERKTAQKTKAAAMAKKFESRPGYRRAWIEDDRVCVEVDVNSNATFVDNYHLFRRVWGAEWPIVRSSRTNQIPALEFTSHGA